MSATSTREDRRLLLRYHEQGDTAAREELVERFLPLARQLARRYQRTNELAGQLECSEEEVLEAMEAASAYDAVSLEQQRSDTDNGSSTDTFQDKLGTEEERYELVEYGATIAPTLKALSARERLILHLRFVEDMTQSEIAERIGVSQMHVSRLIRRSLARLRTVAEHDRGH